MQEQLSDSTVQQVREVISDAGILVGNDFGLKAVNNNFSLHDGSKVFVKLLGVGNSPASFYKEVRVASMLSYAAQPLLPVMDSNGLVFSVWEYTPHSAVEASTACLEDMDSMLEALTELYGLEPSIVDVPFEGFKPDIPLQRLDSIKHIAPPVLWRKVFKLVSEEALTVCVFLNASLGNLHLVHGDLSLNNTLKRLSDGRVVLVDHESVHVSSLEYDLAGMYQYMVQFGEREDLWTHVRKRLENQFLQASINEDLLWKMVIFKNIMGLTFLMKKHKWKAAEKRYAMIQKRLKA